MAFFRKVAKWADSRLTPYGWKKTAFLKNPGDRTFRRYAGTAFKRIVRRAMNAGKPTSSLGETERLKSTLKDVNDTLMLPKNKAAAWLAALAEVEDNLEAKFPVRDYRRPPALDEFAMYAYIQAAQIYHTDGEREYEDGERNAALGKYKQAFECWKKAIGKMEEMNYTLRDVDKIQFYMWAAGSADKAGLREEARPYVDKVVQTAREGRTSNYPAYNDAIRRITKYLAMLDYASEAVEIYADRLSALPAAEAAEAAAEAKAMLGDIFGISYELKFPALGKMVMERTLDRIGKHIQSLIEMKDSAVLIASELELIKNMAAAWRAQEFDDSFGFKDQEEIIARLDFPGMVKGMAEKYTTGAGEAAGKKFTTGGGYIARKLMNLAAELAENEGNGARASEFREIASGIDLQHISEIASAGKSD